MTAGTQQQQAFVSPATALLILKALDAALLAVQVAPSLIRRYQESRDAIEAMILEGRNPTAEEQQLMDDVVIALREQLHRPIGEPTA